MDLDLVRILPLAKELTVSGCLIFAVIFLTKLWLQERRERQQLQGLLLSITSARLAEQAQESAPSRAVQEPTI